MPSSIVSVEKLTEAFSLALEDRTKEIADLVSNSNALYTMIKENGGWKEFSGPTIRERLLFAESGTYKRYSQWEFLNPKPAELFNDAEYAPKLAAVSIAISGEDILKNSGKNQLIDIFEAKYKAAQRELVDRFYEDLHGDGILDGGRQIGGLGLAVPVTNTSGIYGGIDRAAVPLWRTGSYTGTSLVGAPVSAANIHDVYSALLNLHTRGKDGPNLAAADNVHFRMFQQSVMAIQRVTNEKGKLGRLGFTSLAYAGMGREMEIVLEGGIGSAMPSGTTYFLKLGDDGIKFRYHPDRNFTPLGGKQRPINQDGIIQHIGFYGNLTMANPLWQARLRT